MTNKEDVLKVYLELVKLRKDKWKIGLGLKKVEGNRGICRYIDKVCPEVKHPSHIILDYFSTWDKFSGRSFFPVPNPRRRNSENAFREYALNDRNMFTLFTGYGRMRWDLVDHLIKKLAIDVEELYRHD